MLVKTEALVEGKGSRRTLLRTLLVLVTLFPAIHAMAPAPTGSAQPVPLVEDEPELRSEVFWATAYCDEGITKSGVPVAPGIVAADPAVIPLGSVICVEGSDYDGLYQVMDTGRLVRRRTIDIYIPSLQQAMEFGRRRVNVTVLRRGFPNGSQQSELRTR